jgi:hypothetical protein
MLRKLANAGLIIFLMVSGLFILLYVVAFFDKVLHPQYKNLSMRDYGWLGLIAIALLIVDYFIIKRFRNK